MIYKKINNITKNNLLNLVTSYTKHSNVKNKPLNIFTLISNTYHKEDFHSDIISAILNYDKRIFHDFMNIIKLNSKSGINLSDYENVTINREKWNIDILIYSPITKRAIIIENKINNAVDQPKQLPRYYAKMVNEGYKVDAVVYLSIDGIKFPNTNDWDDNNVKQTILKKLIKIAAFNNTETDIYSLLKKYTNDPDKDVAYFSSQYSELLLIISKQYLVKKKLMSEFYEELLNQDTSSFVRGLIKMYDDIPNYYALRTQEEFNSNTKPFESIKIWNNTAYFDCFKMGSSDFAIDLIHRKNDIAVIFFDRNDGVDKNGISSVYFLLQKIDSNLLGFKKIDNSLRFIRLFSFPDEEKHVYLFIKTFLERLQTLKSAKMNEL